MINELVLWLIKNTYLKTALKECFNFLSILQKMNWEEILEVFCAFKLVGKFPKHYQKIPLPEANFSL